MKSKKEKLISCLSKSKTKKFNRLSKTSKSLPTPLSDTTLGIKVYTCNFSAQWKTRTKISAMMCFFFFSEFFKIITKEWQRALKMLRNTWIICSINLLFSFLSVRKPQSAIKLSTFFLKWQMTFLFLILPESHLKNISCPESKPQNPKP